MSSQFDDRLRRVEIALQQVRQRRMVRQRSLDNSLRRIHSCSQKYFVKEQGPRQIKRQRSRGDSIQNQLSRQLGCQTSQGQIQQAEYLVKKNECLRKMVQGIVQKLGIQINKGFQNY